MSKTKGHKVRAHANAQKKGITNKAELKVSWKDMQLPLEQLEYALAATGVQIWNLCKPATIRLTQEQVDEYKSLVVSTNRDLNELQAEFQEIKTIIESKKGRDVQLDDAIDIYTLGSTVAGISDRVEGALANDIERMRHLYTTGVLNDTKFGEKNNEPG